MPKFYILDHDIKENMSTKIVGEDAIHISKSLRMNVGDELIICDGRHSNFLAVIKDVKKEHIDIQIKNKVNQDNESKIHIKLFIALTKGEKFEYAIQKCVELGVYEIIPVETSRTVAKVKSKNIDKKISRWNKIAYHACKQSGRSYIPQVKHPISFDEAVKIMDEKENSIIAYVSENQVSLREYLKNLNSHVEEVNVFIGPEGGFSEDEVSYASEHNVTSIYLGPRILRAETAAIYTTASILYELGEMDEKPQKI